MTSLSLDNSALAVLVATERKLAECQDLSSVVDIRGEAEVLRIYAKARNLGLRLQNRAARIKIHAERRLGQALRELRLRGGDRRSNSHAESLKLIHLGIGRNESSRWQKEASVPEAVFSSYCDAQDARGEEISTSSFIRHICRLYEPSTPSVRKPNKLRASRFCHVGSEQQPPVVPHVCDYDELFGHLDTLERMFNTVCERMASQLEPIERREIPRYIQRIRQLLTTSALSAQVTR
jgi:hypothetical protein